MSHIAQWWINEKFKKFKVIYLWLLRNLQWDFNNSPRKVYFQLIKTLIWSILKRLLRTYIVTFFGNRSNLVFLDSTLTYKDYLWEEKKIIKKGKRIKRGSILIWKGNNNRLISNEIAQQISQNGSIHFVDVNGQGVYL